MLPSLRVTTTNINIRAATTSPSVRRASIVPTQRVQSGGSVAIQTSGGIIFAGKGYLMGMLGLTYIKSYTSPIVTTAVVSDFKPSLRIQNV